MCDLQRAHALLFADHLGKPLERYFRGHPRVRILRTVERGGLTRARLLGFQAATTEIVVFLDSHIECTQGQNSRRHGDEREKIFFKVPSTSSWVSLKVHSSSLKPLRSSANVKSGRGINHGRHPLCATHPLCHLPPMPPVRYATSPLWHQFAMPPVHCAT